MRLRTVIMLLIAVGTAAGTAFVARNWIANQRALLDAEFASRQVAPAPKVTAMEILVAKRGLPVGTFLKLAQFEWRPFPEDGVAETYIRREGFEDTILEGAVLRAGLTAGDPLTAGRLVRPGERGFLAAVLKPGMRAVSVPINATTGISGFVFPGDGVDLLLTHKVKIGGTHRRATETLLHDIRVLAVDQRTNDQEGEPTLAKTATLEVKPKQAEVIAVAMEMGRLSLALRALAQYPDAPATATPFEVADRLPETALRRASETVLPGGVGGLDQGGVTPVVEATKVVFTSASDENGIAAQPPERPTITRDSDISRLIGGSGGPKRKAVKPRSAAAKIEIVRAGAVETIAFKSGGGGTKSSAPASGTEERKLLNTMTKLFSAASASGGETSQ